MRQGDYGRSFYIPTEIFDQLDSMLPGQGRRRVGVEELLLAIARDFIGDPGWYEDALRRQLGPVRAAGVLRSAGCGGSLNRLGLEAGASHGSSDAA